MTPRPWVERIDEANAQARQPVLLIPSPEIAVSSWKAWAQVFEAAGYAVLAIEWPADVSGSDAERAAAYYADIARTLNSRPAIVGHGPGGSVARKLAQAGLSAATVLLPFGRSPAGPSSLASMSLTEEGEATRPLFVATGEGDPFDLRAAEAALNFIQRFV